MKTITVTDEGSLPAARMHSRIAEKHAQAGRLEFAASAHEEASREFVKAGALADAVTAQAAAKALRAGSVTTAANTGGATVATPAPAISPADGSDLSAQELYQWRMTHREAPAPQSASETLTGHALYEHRLLHRGK